MLTSSESYIIRNSTALNTELYHHTESAKIPSRCTKYTEFNGLLICAAFVCIAALIYVVFIEGIVLRTKADDVLRPSVFSEASPSVGKNPASSSPTAHAVRADWWHMRPSSAGFPALPAPLWDTSVAPPHWAAGTNWTTFPPLGMDELERSFTAPLTLDAWCPWIHSTALLESGAHVDIAVIGGSVTKGAKCGVSCAWVSHLSAWFARARPNWNVTVTNLGESGIGSHEWVYRDDPFLAKRRPDIILVDTSVSRRHQSDGCVLNLYSTLYIMQFILSAGQHFPPHGACAACQHGPPPLETLTGC